MIELKLILGSLAVIPGIIHVDFPKPEVTTIYTTIRQWEQGLKNPRAFP